MKDWKNLVINKNKLTVDINGIYVSSSNYSEYINISKEAWERIHKFSLKDLISFRKNFDEEKLADHLTYIENSYSFSKESVYLEIGCGPAHIAEYLMGKYSCKFIGMDFNYELLVTLKKYLNSKGYSDFILIHTDINNMPINSNSVDYVYGGGVIEHFPDTSHILRELFRVLRDGGVSFNTVPSLNLWWLFTFYYTIPNLPLFRVIFEKIHSGVFKNKLLKSKSGYQLGFTIKSLEKLHFEEGFKNIDCGSFIVRPSKGKLGNKLFISLYMLAQKFPLLSPVYYVKAEKY